MNENEDENERRKREESVHKFCGQRKLEVMRRVNGGSLEKKCYLLIL